MGRFSKSRILNNFFCLISRYLNFLLMITPLEALWDLNVPCHIDAKNILYHCLY